MNSAVFITFLALLPSLSHAGRGGMISGEPADVEIARICTASPSPHSKASPVTQVIELYEPASRAHGIQFKNSQGQHIRLREGQWVLAGRWDNVPGRESQSKAGDLMLAYEDNSAHPDMGPVTLFGFVKFMSGGAGRIESANENVVPALELSNCTYQATAQ